MKTLSYALLIMLATTFNPISATESPEQSVSLPQTTQQWQGAETLTRLNWNGGLHVDHFLVMPTGAAAQSKTDCRLLDSKDSLLARCTAYEPNDQRTSDNAQVMRGDYIALELFVISGKRMDQWIFLVNPQGNRSALSPATPSWNGEWETRVIATPSNWTVYFNIPYKSLKLAQAADQDWHLALVRSDVRNHSVVTWPFVSGAKPASLASSARIKGLRIP